MKKNTDKQAMCLKTFELIGDKHTMAILYTLARSDERFCELQRAVKLNPITLTDRLKKLEGLKLVKRTKGSANKLSVTYSLTALGRETRPIFDKIETFAVKL